MRFYYDVVCPFAYLASTRIADLAAEAGVQLEWKPILLGGVLRAVGAPDVPMQTMPAAKARLTVLDALRQADLAGVPLRFPDSHPRRTVNAMRLLLAADPEVRPRLTADLYRAYWADGLDVSDLTVLRQLAAPYGLDVDRLVQDPPVRQALFDATAEAVDRGVFGVPTVEVEGELYWGADRLEQVRDVLGLPRREVGIRKTGGVVTFFHDFSSPYSYLASERIGELAEQAGAEVRWTPFLLGALFKTLGGPIVPIASFSSARQRFLRKDMARVAARLGVPFQFPSNFPLNTVTALRVALLEPRATRPLYRAAWAEDVDIGDPERLQGVLDAAGLPGADLIARTAEPEVKARLRANTERAVRAGVCGAPSFLVGEQVFWGQDRLDQVLHALSGWAVGLPPSR